MSELDQKSAERAAAEGWRQFLHEEWRSYFPPLTNILQWGIENGVKKFLDAHKKEIIEAIARQAVQK